MEGPPIFGASKPTAKPAVAGPSATDKAIKAAKTARKILILRLRLRWICANRVSASSHRFLRGDHQPTPRGASPRPGASKPLILVVLPQNAFSGPAGTRVTFLVRFGTIFGKKDPLHSIEARAARMALQNRPVLLEYLECRHLIDARTGIGDFIEPNSLNRAAWGFGLCRIRDGFLERYLSGWR